MTNEEMESESLTDHCQAVRTRVRMRPEILTLSGWWACVVIAYSLSYPALL